MKTNLQGKVAIITGSGSSIGAESTRMPARESTAVMLNDRREDALRQVQSERLQAGGRYECLAGYLSQPDFCQKLVDHTSSDMSIF